MKPILLVGVATIGLAASMATSAGRASEEASPIYGVTIPSGYRDWQLISVTHEEGDFNQLRAQLGNQIAMNAYREGKLPFPDGSIIVALHWKRVPSDEDNQVFGRVQAFVPGSPVNMQVISEPAAKIVIDPPLPEPLASRGVAINQYCAQNLHIAPVFGPGAVTASPRVGHIHVSLDDASWVWADASGNPIILQRLSPGPHTVHITLVDANHHPLDEGKVTFVIPEKVEHH